MENSPPLTAKDFDMPYKKLAEFDGVVLGGIEQETTGDFEFATWSSSDNGLYWGHYYRTYSKEKEDFALRSGLVKGSKLFNDEECVKSTNMENPAWKYGSFMRMAETQNISAQIQCMQRTMKHRERKWRMSSILI